MNASNWDKYTMQNGMLSSSTTPNDNMVGYTSQLITLLDASKTFSPVARHRTALYSEALSRYELKSGLWSTAPTFENNCKIDDYLSVASCDISVAQRILAQGRAAWGFFDLATPNQKPWPTIKNIFKWPWPRFLRRNAGFWTHAQYKAGEKPGWFNRFAWVVSIFGAARKPIQVQDGWMQSHMMIMAYSQSQYKSWLCNKAVAYWWKKKPVPMRDIVASYLGPAIYPDHPLYVCWDDFGAPATLKS